MIITPAGMPTLPQAILDAQTEPAAIRMGTVASLDAMGRWLLVRIADSVTATPAVWLTSYEPLVGDVVAVSRQGAAWVVLGSLASAIDEASNAVANYTFDQGDAGAIPPRWQLVTSAGSPTLLTSDYNRADRVGGTRVARLLSPGAATVTTEVVSDTAPVMTSQYWAAGGWVRTLTDFNVATVCSVQLYIAWYSGQSLSDFLSQNSSGTYAVYRGMPWTFLRVQGTQGIVAPVNATHMRVKFAFSWEAAAGDAIYIDRVIARRV